MYAIYETEGSQLLFFGEGEEDIVDLNEAEEFLRNLTKSILMVWLPSISRAKYFGRLVKLLDNSSERCSNYRKFRDAL
jgi:hypothetical protein